VRKYRPARSDKPRPPLSDEEKLLQELERQFMFSDATFLCEMKNRGAHPVAAVALLNEVKQGRGLAYWVDRAASGTGYRKEGEV
jgi:hypothetical protein